MKPYAIYIAMIFILLVSIRGVLKIDRIERNDRLYDELCKVDQEYCNK